MKNILKSVVTIGALMTVVVASTGAYFTSSVVAEDNIIETGTLLVAVDTAQEDTYVGTWSAGNAFNVIRQLVDGTVQQPGNFITWSNAAPGETHTYTVGVRNNGTIPFKFRAGATGAWVSGPAFGSPGCPAVDASDADASLVQVTSVQQYALTPTTGCLNEIGCRNLRDGLINLGTGWAPVAGLTANTTGPVAGYYYGVNEGTGLSTDTPTLIGEKEFAIYQVAVTLDGTDTNSCYQGATYHFDFAVDGTQEAGTL